MFEATAMLFIYVETPLHAGTARGLGAVDLPIQRERTTDYPIVQASSLKGRLRAAAAPALNRAPLTREEHTAIFGPGREDNASDHAGALSVGDARILLFPVRSLAGVFAWTTSVDALARFQRESALVGLSPGWNLPAQVEKDTAWVSDDALLAGGQVVLEEFSYTPVQQPDTVRAIAEWLADNALPQSDEHRYWRNALPAKLCILPEDDFRDFVRYGTEVQTHISLDPTTKTVAGTALWTTESLPVDTLLYVPLLATKSRRNGMDLTAQQVIGKLTGLDLTRTQLGGDETTGQGIVALRFHNGATAPAGGAS